MMQGSFTVLQVFLLGFSVMFLSSSSVVDAASPTIVSINPVNQTVSAGDSFTIAVMCAPQQAIKAFELKILFDPSLLAATMVSEGNFFDNFTTFFSAGLINNTAGTIINIYDLVVGVGNVTNPGSLVLITFTARSVSGTSPVRLSEVQVTNESDYLVVSVFSGNVTVNSEAPPSNYTITAIAGSGGSITPLGSVFVNAGADQIFTITPDFEYSILEVRVDNVSIGLVSTYTFYDVVVDHTITVSFTLVEPPPPSEPPEYPPSLGDTPPSRPLPPYGLTFVDVGTVSNYSSAAYDCDGDLLRLRFDWGDGSVSNWTGFVASNTSVYLLHVWMNASNCFIRVIAQDSTGRNSSWSDPLMVNISQEESGGRPPMGMFLVPQNVTLNQTVFFDASGIYDPDGEIVSYHWDFGDGATGFGEHPIHIYQVPGTYTVTVTVVDESGETAIFSKMVTILAAPAGPMENSQNIFISFFNLIILITGIIVFLVLFLKFKDNIEKVYVQKRIERKKKRLALKEYNQISEIEQLIDEMVLGTKQKIPSFTKDSILSAYNDLISAKVRKNPAYHPPDVSIDEIEKLVDYRIQSLIEAEVDKL